MKNYLILLLALVSYLPMVAQSTDKPAAQEQFFKAKSTEMCKQLRLSDEQIKRFIPIYQSYDKDMRKVWTKYRATKDCRNDISRTKMRLVRQKELQEIRIRYVDKFHKVLTDQQVDKFYRTESDIQKKVKHRKETHKNRKPKTPKGKSQSDCKKKH